MEKFYTIVVIFVKWICRKFNSDCPAPRGKAWKCSKCINTLGEEQHNEQESEV